MSKGKRKQPLDEVPTFDGPSKRRKGGKPAKLPSRDAVLADKTPFLTDDRLNEAALYDLLGSEDAEERLKAADTIISKLLDGDGVSESLLDRHLEKRLFRGLASSRKASRLGFSVVLTEVMQQLWGEKDLQGNRYRGLTFEFVLATLTERTGLAGKASGQDERDHYFGQLFGLECFVRASVLFTDITKWHRILAILCQLAAKKSWLRSNCAWVIIQAIPQMDRSAAEATLQRLTDAGSWSKSPEGVAIWTVMLQRFPKMKVPSKTWQDPLSPKSFQELSKALKEAVKEEGGDEVVDKQNPGHSSSQLHFVWDIILAHFTKQASAGQTGPFKQFWDRVVDDGFFSKNASDSQKFKGFLIFTRFLEGGHPHNSILQSVFSPHLMTCLINQATKQDRYLHRAAVKALSVIQQTAETRPSSIIILLRGLLGPYGAFNFDQRTSSKTVEKALQYARSEDVAGVITTLKQLVLESASDNARQRSITYIEYLYKLCQSNSNAGEGLALVELVQYAYPSKDQSKQGDDLKGLARERFQSALAKSLKAGEATEIPNAILSIDPQSVMDWDEELKQELTTARKALKDLLKKSKDAKVNPLPSVLAQLYAVGILQLYNEEPDAVDILGSLQDCESRLSRGTSGSSTAGASVTLIEVLLSMAAKNSPLLRQVSEKVFEGFSALMTAEALNLLTDTLAAKEDVEGLQSLFDAEVDAEMEAPASDAESDDEENLDSDVELVDLPETDGKHAVLSDDVSASGSDSDGDSEGESDDDAGDDQVIQIDDALANILKSHRLDRDKDAESSSDDSDMSDSEMMAMDEKLAEVFKQRAKNPKKDKKDAKETMIVFKHRVLDLLAIYARKEALGSLVLEIMIPLLDLIRTTKTKDLSKKAIDILLSIQTGIRKAKSSKSLIPAVETEPLLSLLADLHEEADKDPSQEFAKSASTASLIVVQRLLIENEEALPDIWELYGKTGLKWQLGQVRFHVSFFSAWTQYWQSHRSAGN